MHFLASLAVAAAARVASAAHVSAPITVSLTRVSNVKSAKSLVDAGNARLRNFNNAGGDEDVTTESEPITNEILSYVANVTIGGGIHSLKVDTGCKSSIACCALREDRLLTALQPPFFGAVPALPARGL